MKIRYKGMDTEIARKYWQGGLDDDGNRVEVAISSGDGVPCRHCLRGVAAGEKYLILAHRPFPTKGAYSEMGPIFLHQSPCEPFPPSASPPTMFAKRDQYLMRAYDANHRILYGSGGPVGTQDLSKRASELLAQEGPAYVHLRSIGYNCFLCRIEREESPWVPDGANASLRATLPKNLCENDGGEGNGNHR